MISAVGIGPVRESGVKGGCRIEQLLHKGQVVVLLERAEDAEVNGQVVVECLLRDVEFGDIVAIVVGADNGLVLRHTNGGTIVGRLRAAAKGDVVILHEARPFDAPAEVSISTLVDIGHAERRGGLTELRGIEHLHPLVDRLHTDRAVVRDVELLTAPLLRGHLDNACCPSATVLGCLRGILQDGETLDVGRVDSRERGQVGCHAVDDHKRVVASRQRGSASHTDCRHHRLLIAARGHLHTSRLAAQRVKRRDDHTLVHTLLRHLVDGSRQRVLRTRHVAHSHCRRHRVTRRCLCSRRRHSHQ